MQFRFVESSCNCLIFFYSHFIIYANLLFDIYLVHFALKQVSNLSNEADLLTINFLFSLNLNDKLKGKDAGKRSKKQIKIIFENA